MEHSTFIAVICAGALAVTAGAALARGPMSFDTLDIDGDGQVTQAEMTQARSARFTAADTNGDGVLDKAELTARAREQAPERTDRMMTRMDANGDGVLSLEELTERQGRRGDMFARVDADGDGGISRDEFDAMRDKMHKRHRGAQD